MLALPNFLKHFLVEYDASKKRGGCSVDATRWKNFGFFMPRFEGKSIGFIHLRKRVIGSSIGSEEVETSLLVEIYFCDNNRSIES